MPGVQNLRMLSLLGLCSVECDHPWWPHKGTLGLACEPVQSFGAACPPLIHGRIELSAGARLWSNFLVSLKNPSW